MAMAGVAARWDVLREQMLFGGASPDRMAVSEKMLYGGASPLTEWDCKSGSGGLEKQKIFLFLFVFVNRLEDWLKIGWRSVEGRLKVGWR